MCIAKFNETMILANAMCVSPPKGLGGPAKQGFRDVVQQVDNAQDLRTYVLNHSAKVGPKHKDPKYEAHHVSRHPLGRMFALTSPRLKPQNPCLSRSQALSHPRWRIDNRCLPNRCRHSRCRPNRCHRSRCMRHNLSILSTLSNTSHLSCRLLRRTSINRHLDSTAGIRPPFRLNLRHRLTTPFITLPPNRMGHLPDTLPGPPGTILAPGRTHGRLRMIQAPKTTRPASPSINSHRNTTIFTVKGAAHRLPTIRRLNMARPQTASLPVATIPHRLRTAVPRHRRAPRLPDQP